jgi:hypothetical protein
MTQSAHDHRCIPKRCCEATEKIPQQEGQWRNKEITDTERVLSIHEDDNGIKVQTSQPPSRFPQGSTPATIALLNLPLSVPRHPEFDDQIPTLKLLCSKRGMCAMAGRRKKKA